eukprot:GHRQ01021092.1.p1 GENE.GHRQ01021092.1~~GHRQ01021092.1.p1  ORF type:complete len:245 (-),score=27.71 GHRQ01021092.1:347-1081(-)
MPCMQVSAFLLLKLLHSSSLLSKCIAQAYWCMLMYPSQLCTRLNWLLSICNTRAAPAHQHTSALDTPHTSHGLHACTPPATQDFACSQVQTLCPTLLPCPAGRTPTPAAHRLAQQLRCPPAAVWTRPTPDRDEDFTRPSYVPTPGGSPVVQPYREDQPLYAPSAPEFKPAEMPEQQKEMPKGPTMPGDQTKTCSSISGTCTAQSLQQQTGTLLVSGASTAIGRGLGGVCNSCQKLASDICRITV